MASPLAAFRKYDKVLLAVFGVLLMFAFLVGDPLMMMGGGGSGGGGLGPGGAAVTYQGGALTELQLAVMNQADRAASEVYRRVYMKTLEEKRTPRSFPWPSRAGDERGLVYNKLLAEKAHDLGMSLSDENIDEMLIELSDKAVTADDLKKIRREVLDDFRGSSYQINERDLYSQLRTNYLAQQMLALLRNSAEMQQQPEMEVFRLTSATSPTMTMTPAQGWDYFRRTARMVEVELLPLDVAKFVDEVTGQPTNAQKTELFEKYKETIASPASPEPGLARPHKIAFSYLRMDFSKYLEEAKANVTEEAIRAEYEDRKTRGDLNVPDLPADKDDVKKDDKDTEDKESTENKEGADDKEATKPDETEKPAETEPDDKPAEPKEGEEKPVEPKDEAAPSDTKEKPSEPTTDPERNGEEEEQSFEEEEVADEPAATEPEVETTAEPKENTKPANKEGEEPADESKTETPTDETKPDETKPDETKPDETKPVETKPDETKPDETKPDPKKPATRVRTYDEMKDEIRDRLAQKPAEDKRREAVEKIVEVLQAYKVKHADWEAKKTIGETEKKAAQEQPELEPMLRNVLKKYGLTFKQLDLMDRYEITDDELGKSSLFTGRQSLAFPEIAYDPQVPLFEPFQIGGGILSDVSYIFWKEREQESKAAERKDVEDQIVQAWKMQKAFDLAKAEAESLAAQAKGKESLRAAFPQGVEKAGAGAIQETKPFSWLTTGPLPFGMAPLQLSQIPEVPYAGEEFMQAVMDLEPGEVGVAPDQSHRHVYVVRVISQTPSEERLREMFLTRGIVDRNIAMQYAAARSEQFGTWLGNMEKEMQLTWHRPPQQFEQ